MKANELRIGNWVNPEKPYQINANSFQNVFQENFDEEPIPLTEEWLEKFGFEFDPNKGFEYTDEDTGENRKIEDNPYYYKLYNLSEYPYELRFCVFLKQNLFYHLSTKLKYIHQLQNLHHALTGEELTIKELTT